MNLNFSVFYLIFSYSRDLEAITCEAVAATAHYCVAFVFQPDNARRMCFNSFGVFFLS